MSDELNPPADRPLSEEELAQLERLEREATAAPWWYDEGPQYWRLHGTGGWTPEQGGGEFKIPSQPLNHQIIKAAKQSEIFMPYWPNEPDGMLIPKMRNALPRLLKELRELREAAQKCTCEQEGTTHTCPLHGLVSLLREAHEEIKELREHLDAYERWARQAPVRVDVEITEDGEDG